MSYELNLPFPRKPMKVVVEIEVPDDWEEGYALSELAGVITTIGKSLLYGHRDFGSVTYNSVEYQFEVEDQL